MAQSTSRAAPLRKEPAAARRDIRRELLEAATETFVRQGYEATTVEDLLRAAGVSRHSFYRLFKGKPGIYEAVATDWARRIMVRVAESVNAVRGPEAQLRAGVGSFFENLDEIGGLFGVIEAQAAVPGSPTDQARRWVINRIVDFFLEQVAELPDLRPVDPAVVRAATAAFESLGLLYVRDARPEQRDRYRDAAVFLAWRCLTASTLGDPPDLRSA